MNPELHSMNYDELNQHNSMTPKVATDQSPTTLYIKHKKKKINSAISPNNDSIHLKGWQIILLTDSTT